MKKILALLWACTLSASLFAQLPDGSIAPNFTATDLDGNTWNLYDVLDQGKSVIISFSAAWSGPDWNYSNTNILEQFYQLHGPNGDNTLRIFWIEGDVNTSVECITNSPGCTGFSQGDFTAGKTYPFFDDADASLMTAYAINYYPTIYLICSDRVLKEVGQVGVVGLEYEADGCPVITSTSKLITGSVVNDDNSNCSVDNGEAVLSNWGVTVNGQNNTSNSTFTNANGVFRVYVDSVNTPFTLSFTPPNPLWTSCLPEPVVVANAADTIIVYHPATPEVLCPQLRTILGIPWLRRCFDNTFSVKVCNEGSSSAQNAYVDVTLPSPELLPLSSASMPYTTLSPGVYRFELGDLAIGACFYFSLTAKVSCDSVQIGETLCLEAHAYPDTLCVPVNSSWNGANIVVKATCNNNSPEFSIQNEGNADMLEAQDYIVIEDDVMVSEGTFQLNAGASQTIPVPNNGATWRVEALQVPFHPVSGNPSASLEGCTVSSSFSTGFVLGYPVHDPLPAQDIECMQVIGSWDPNDKTGFPLGISNQHLISKNTDIDYLIRFQNTGTDTAFNIVVRDTLSAKLDARSIRLGASSHAYEYSLENGNILVFNFKDIKLVDSFANEPGSHGYLRFKVAQQPNLAAGTQIENEAAIYFDFNPPIFTNTTLHRIGAVPHVSSVYHIAGKNNQISVYPNPLNGALSIRTETELPLESRWVLYDFAGRLISSGNMNGNVASIGAALKTEGIYYIGFVGKDGQSLGGALVKN